jgi:hypothetical protein
MAGCLPPDFGHWRPPYEKRDAHHDAAIAKSQLGPGDTSSTTWDAKEPQVNPAEAALVSGATGLVPVRTFRNTAMAEHGILAKTSDVWVHYLL